MKKIDLHTHTNCSDGSMTPTELMRHAKEVGLAAIALTDHDTLAGLEEAEGEAARLGVEFVPGVEFSTEANSQVHILGYYIDRDNKELLAVFRELREERKRTHALYLEKLAEYGFPLDNEELKKAVPSGNLGRAHYARMMVEKGYVGSVKEAFDNYLRVGGPCYIRRDVPHPREAIRLIHNAGGAAFFAHPHQTKLSDEGIFALMKELADAGLDGVEGYYSEYDEQMGEKFRKMASDLGLLLSGGSDYHAKMKPHIELGSGINGNLTVPYELLEGIKIRCRR